jgi:8-oxo-dGTP diphosphatase
VVTPGGHVDEGTNLEDAVRQEVREELGADSQFLTDKPYFITRTRTTGKNAEHIDVTYWFLLKGNPRDKYAIQAEEASAAGWFYIQDLLSNPAFRHLHRALAKLQAALANGGI